MASFCYAQPHGRGPTTKLDGRICDPRTRIPKKTLFAASESQQFDKNVFLYIELLTNTQYHRICLDSSAFRRIEHASQFVEFANNQFRLYSIQQ